MRVRLLGPDTDFDPAAAEPAFADDLAQDLQLDLLWDAMAQGDAFLRTVARAAILHPLPDPDAIVFRQRALADCASHPDEVAELYGIAVDALALERGSLMMMPLHGRPEMVLSRSLRMLTGLVERLDRLRRRGEDMAPGFASPAFRGLFATIARELDDGYLRLLRRRIRELSFPDGLLMSAGVGRAGQVVHPVLRSVEEGRRRLFGRVPLLRPNFSFTLPDRDEAGSQALAELRDRSLADVANAAAQSVDHVLAFFAALRAELGVLLAGGNLAAALDRIGVPICTPDPGAEAGVRASGVVDPCLALRTGSAPVGNDVDLGAGRLLVVTGANRGGKSTLLRALGTAQLMMQAGLFAPATAFAARPVGQVLPHWAREEDEGLRHGKLDEELERMSRIVEVVRPGDLLLCNESFSSTNEAEGSQILLEVTRALIAAGVQIRSVTHLYDFAHAVEELPELGAVFLRAPRAEHGERSFRLEPGPPRRTSFGLDLYDRAFGTRYADAG